MLTFRFGVGGGDDADVGCAVTTGCVFSLLSGIVACDIFRYLLDMEKQKHEKSYETHVTRLHSNVHGGKIAHPS